MDEELPQPAEDLLTHVQRAACSSLITDDEREQLRAIQARVAPARHHTNQRPRAAVMTCTMATRFMAPGYRTDGEILREVTELNERLTGDFPADDQRGEAEERLAALKEEQESRRRARSNREDL